MGGLHTGIESLALAQQANLETRPAKHEPRSEAEQRHAWRQQATTVLAGDGTSPREMVTAAVGARWGRTRQRGRDPREDVRPQALATRVLETLEGSRATWQVWHVRAEALRQARAAEVPLAELPGYVRDLEHRVLTQLSVPVGVPPDLREPEVLRRPDGQSAHVVHGSQSYTSKAILAAEEELLGLGLRRDGRQVGPELVEAVLGNPSTAEVVLDLSQAAMVRNLATSGCRVQVALAPAGAGKTAALRALARAWEASGGTVLGLAPTAVAADELGRATGIHADTLAKHLHQNTASQAGTLPRTGPTASWGRGVGPGTLVVIDEAGMAGTRDLADVVRHVAQAGGSVRLVGDDQQLSAVAAGGVFRDLAEQGHAHGTTATLTELHRFTDPAEGAATLAIRDGDAAALNHYIDRDRIHTGDPAAATEAAYAAWAADQQAGMASLLLAATRDTVRELNQRARTDRLDAGQPPGREVALGDGTRASAGDLVITRRNDRTSRAGDGSWVKNGDRWRLVAVHPDGAVSVERQDHSTRTCAARRLTLSAGYVAEHVHLGYASTIHGAQGATVDTTHTVLTGAETRQALYVSLSRGRRTNHLYVATPETSLDGIGPKVQDIPVDPHQMLTDILARDGRAPSATTVERGDAAQLLREAALAYQDAPPVLAQQHLGPEQMAALDDALERWMPGLTEQPAYPHLRGQLALRWVDGAQPQTVIEEATWYRGKQNLAEAADPAAALTWRIAGTTPPSYRDRPLPWLPDVPPVLRHQPDMNDYLDRLSARVEDLKQRVADEAKQVGATDRIPWQRALPPDIDAELIGDLAIWRAAHGIPPTEPSPTGPPMKDPDTSRHQARLAGRLSPPPPSGPRTTPNTEGEKLRASQRRAERHRLSEGSSLGAPGPRR